MPNISPNMNLPVPEVSTDPGPDWAENLNSCLSAIDSHDHSSGSGVQITPDGIDINSSLSMNNYALTSTGSIVFQSQASLATLKALYVISNDIYYNDGAGNVIRITQSGSVSGASGTITGLPSGTASASYDAVGGKFVFQSATSTPADISGATILVSEKVSSPNFISIKSPTSLAAAYNFTLPTAVPAATSFVMMATTGALSTRTITNPTVQKFTTGGDSGTYTTPAGVLYIQVEMVGGGGGGRGSGTGSLGSGGNGGDTTFGSSLLSAGGGTGATSGTGPAGGSASLGSGPVGVAVAGSNGNGASENTGFGTILAGGAGGVSAFGGGGASGNNSFSSNQNAATNSGSGGGGGGATNTPACVAGSGGASGGYVKAIITSPSATYAYAVGDAGTAGTAGTSGVAGGAGAAGQIIVWEFYQ